MSVDPPSLFKLFSEHELFMGTFMRFKKEMQEEVYVKQSPGFVVTGKEGKVMRLHKALYGIRQAPRAWNAKIDCTLKEIGFKQSEHEHAN